MHDRQAAYAIPTGVIERRLTIYTSIPDCHWHIVLEEDDAKKIILVTRNGSQIPLEPFVVGID
jgi:hypothetical protein